MNDSPFQPMRYGSRVAELLLADRLPELGAGQPNTSARPLLAALSVETLFENGPIVNDDLAQCCLAGLWLWHDFLEESHRISQEIACAEGSYWHGMMHRREADYSNAKYWFRRVGAHEVYQQLSQVPAVPALLGTAWDPYAFVDLCEAIAAGRRADDFAAREVARLEWQFLFAHCWRRARGSG